MTLKDNPTIFNKESFKNLLSNFEGKIPSTRIAQEVSLAKSMGCLIEEDNGNSLEDWYDSVLTLEEDGLKNILVFDVETTHINGYIASIASKRLTLVNSTESVKFNKEETLYSLINPLEKMDPESTKVNKLTDEMLVDQKTFEEFFLSDFKQELEWADIIVAQNAIYDISTLIREAKRCNDIILPDNMFYLDVMTRLKQTIQAKDSAGKLKFPNEKEIATFYSIDISGKELHNAKIDVEVLSESFIKALTE